MEQCKHGTGELVENGFPVFVVMLCSVCGERVMYSGLSMITHEDGIELPEAGIRIYHTPGVGGTE